MSLSERKLKQTSSLIPAGAQIAPARLEAARAVREFQSRMPDLSREQVQTAYARLIVARGFQKAAPESPKAEASKTAAQVAAPKPAHSPDFAQKPNPTNHMKNKPILQALERHLSVVSLLLIAGAGLILLQGPVGHFYSTQASTPAAPVKETSSPAPQANASEAVMGEVASNNQGVKSDSTTSTK
jgi:hypothetical protein